MPIGFEITRGAKAMSDLKVDLNLNIYGQAITDTLNAYKQTHPDSDGYLLGANYGAWKALSGTLTRSNIQNHNDAAALKKAKAAAVAYFQEFRSTQDELSVSDANFLKAIGFRIPDDYAKGIKSLESDEALFSQFASQPH